MIRVKDLNRDFLPTNSGIYMIFHKTKPLLVYILEVTASLHLFALQLLGPFNNHHLAAIDQYTHFKISL